MGRGVPPWGSVLLSPPRYASTPRDGSRTARRGGATPCWVVVEKRKAMGRVVRCAKRRDTTLFRAVCWVPPHPCLPAYTRMYGPHHLLRGLFRALDWRPRKADGCGLYRDMYDTYGAPASWHAYRVAHPEAVRQDAAQHGRVPRACGYRTCPAPPARGPAVGQPHAKRVCTPACRPRGLPLHALQPCQTTRTSSTPRVRPSAGGGTGHSTPHDFSPCPSL